MVSRVQELALGYPEGRIELQLIGGFRDQNGYAEDLYSNIMRKLNLFPTLYVRRQKVSYYKLEKKECC